MRNITAFMITLMLLAGLTGCSRLTAGQQIPPASSSAKLLALQQNKYFYSVLAGNADFTWEDQQMSFSLRLSVSSVPITWNGQVFNGKVVGGGLAQGITDTLHGGVSADGEWLTSLSFERTIEGSGGSWYRVDLKNVPIGALYSDAPQGTVTFSQTADIQKYFSSIVYFSDGGTVFQSMEWSNTTPGLQPSLQFAFEVVASRSLGDAKSGGIC